MSSFLPMISSREYPNMRSAPSLQPVRTPARFAVITPSLADSVSATISSARSSCAESAATAGFFHARSLARRRASWRVRLAGLYCCWETKLGISGRCPFEYGQALALVLGFIHRHVGALDEFLGGHRVGLGAGDSDARAQLQRSA